MSGHTGTTCPGEVTTSLGGGEAEAGTIASASVTLKRRGLPFTPSLFASMRAVTRRSVAATPSSVHARVRCQGALHVPASDPYTRVPTGDAGSPASRAH